MGRNSHRTYARKVRFLRAILTIRTDSCVLWPFRLDRDGYGEIDGEHRRAHRVVASMAHGPAKGRHVLHSCDNPRCVNPGHLRYGTHADNMRDLWSRGQANPRARTPRLLGSEHGRSKLTEAEVIEIRSYYSAGMASANRLAKSYGVARSTVEDLLAHRTWKHVP